MIDFDKLLDNYLVKKSKPRTIGRYYPSEAGRCLRKSWYSFKYPLPMETNLLKIFEMGNMIHDLVVDVLKSEKTPEVELVETELPVKIHEDDFVISGRIDDIITVKSKGITMLVEVKSAKNINYIKEAKEDNAMQLQLYMFATGIHYGILLYVQKNDLKSKVFSVEYDKAVVDSTINRFRVLHDHLVDGTVPVAEAKKDKGMKWMCNYCEYKGRCDEAEGEVDEFERMLDE